MTKNLELSECITQALQTTNYAHNPYFLALEDQSFQKEDFLETQIQFFFAVAFFSRPMSALAGKIPNTELRLNIVRNVFEEHGEGDPNGFHENTFKRLLTRLGISEEEMMKRTLWPEVRTFNTLLTGVCVMDSYLVGVSVLGIIERMFSEISAWIGQGILQNGWLEPNQIIHYSLHEKLDLQHSEEFFEILQKPWQENESNRYFIRQGLLMGAYVFNQLYAGLYDARERRDFRSYFGAHTHQ